MKRTFKRILPILLAIVTICSIIWYLFIYDRGFTRDMMLQGARFFDSQGNHAVAAWMYDQAYRQSKGNADIAIELSDRFKDMGNYTKAENALTGAIADGGSAELYIALSKTYLEQDKLLDAVTMLDSITDPVVKEQLDAIRPAAPTVDTEPGFYNQYLPVTVNPGEGRLYLTTDGQYPSIQNTPHEGVVTLESGENTLYALTVGDNGLVSSLSIFGYTVGGVIEPVELKDPVIDTLVRTQLQVGPETTLYSNQLWEITELEIPEGVTSFEDLSRLSYLQSLTVHGSTADSLEGMQSLTQLTQLTMKGCKVSAVDLLIIASLPKLEKLTLTDCGLSSIENLSAIRTLTHLDLSGNSIRDLSPLSFMSKILELDLSHNALDNLNALSSLSGLEKLNVSYNSLSSVVPLASCTGLKELNISNNTIPALTGIASLTALTSLDASFNSVADVQELTACTELIQLDLSSNALKDISALSVLNKLQHFSFNRNEVVTLPGWSTGCALVTIDGSYNKIKNISGLAGFAQLNMVMMDYNNISSVNALSSCHSLFKVSVYGNPVKDVSKLTEISIIVNYNPTK